MNLQKGELPNFSCIIFFYAKVGITESGKPTAMKRRESSNQMLHKLIVKLTAIDEQQLMLLDLVFAVFLVLKGM